MYVVESRIWGFKEIPLDEVLYIHEQSFQKASQVDLQLDLLYNNGNRIVCDFQNYTMEQNNYLFKI